MANDREILDITHMNTLLMDVQAHIDLIGKILMTTLVGSLQRHTAMRHIIETDVPHSNLEALIQIMVGLWVNILLLLHHVRNFSFETVFPEQVLQCK
jgi:hypothetical protein